MLARRASLALLSIAISACHRAPDLSKEGFGALPAFQLVDQDQRAFSSEQLRGGVWIAAFMYTACPMECPMLAQRMSYLQKLLPQHSSQIKMLSISVNPTQDTPDVLKQYGERFNRDPARWTLVTGHTDPLLVTVAKGYELEERSVGHKPRDGEFTATHADNLVLIDGQGLVRGYYHKDDAEVARLLADADRLATFH